MTAEERYFLQNKFAEIYWFVRNSTLPLSSTGQNQNLQKNQYALVWLEHCSGVVHGAELFYLELQKLLSGMDR